MFRMHGHVNENGRAALRIDMAQYPLFDERRVTEFFSDERTYLSVTFWTRGIGPGGPVPWPPHSPDLSSLGYFLWGHLKNLVYETPLDSDEDGVVRISEVAARVREIPGIPQRARQSLHRRCIAIGGRNFVQLF
ncbi:uncharacterized protein TNCV_4560291 [Trichonephila clavipes]|nr:uncharacterized protein TNCV_4560291 [Trichonephila clavipes]